MPEPLTLARAFTAWTPYWPALVGAAALLAWYLRSARGRDWPLRNTIAFTAGVLLGVWTTCGFLGVYDQALFWVRALQNVVLLMGVPMLVAMGAPLTLLLASAPPPVANRLRLVGRSRPAHLLAYPITVTVALLAPMPLIYLTGLYQLTLDHGAVDLLARLMLVGCGFLYYWTRLRVDPVPGNAAHLTSFAISFAEALVDGILGVIVWLGPRIAEAHYALRDWGPSMHQDQTMGAIALWFGGDMISLVYLGALFVQWFRDDSRAARRIDAELDQSERDEPLQDGLWWERDPRYRG